MPGRVAAGIKFVVLLSSSRGGLAQTGGSSMQKKANTAKHQLLLLLVRAGGSWFTNVLCPALSRACNSHRQRVAKLGVVN